MPLPTELVLFRATPPIELPQAELRIHVPEAWRGAVYRPALETARLAFDDYAARNPRVALALRDKGLLERLALALDDYLAPCVVADVNEFNKTRYPGQNVTEDTYLQYIGACLQGQEDPYSPGPLASTALAVSRPWAGIDALFGRYPLMRYMLATMGSQYVRAVLRCCDRLLQDWDDIAAFFFNAGLAALTGIRGTGSDFHKGGQQVFLLMFLDAGNAPRELVYKPSDVERDFRIVGDTQALAAAINNLHVVTTKGVTANNLLNNAAGSLVEMVTTLAAQDQVTVPVTKYKILPVHPGTSLPVQPSGGCDVRESYGWIEYLSNDLQDRDCQDKVELSRYYETFGALVALAYVFQITDLHQENVIVHAQQPYLIDLEMAYVGIMETPDGTNLNAAYRVFASPVLAREVGGWNLPTLSYGAPTATMPTKNQPYFKGAPYTPQSTDAPAVAAVFGRTTTLIQDHANDFAGWLNAAARVIARIVPFGTAELLVRLRAINNPTSYIPAFRPDEVRLRTEAFTESGQVSEGAIAPWGDQFATTANGVGTPLDLMLVYDNIQPRFLCWLAPQTADDFIHGDIPVFYQRSDTGLALDSRGNPIPVSFDRAIQLATANNRAPIVAILTQVWNTQTLLPATYFPGSVNAVQRAYLTQLQNTPAFSGPRLKDAYKSILNW